MTLPQPAQYHYCYYYYFFILKSFFCSSLKDSVNWKPPEAIVQLYLICGSNGGLGNSVTCSVAGTAFDCARYGADWQTYPARRKGSCRDSLMEFAVWSRKWQDTVSMGRWWALGPSQTACEDLALSKHGWAGRSWEGGCSADTATEAACEIDGESFMEIWPGSWGGWNGAAAEVALVLARELLGSMVELNIESKALPFLPWTLVTLNVFVFLFSFILPQAEKNVAVP